MNRNIITNEEVSRQAKAHLYSMSVTERHIKFAGHVVRGSERGLPRAAIRWRPPNRRRGQGQTKATPRSTVRDDRPSVRVNWVDVDPMAAAATESVGEPSMPDAPKVSAGTESKIQILATPPETCKHHDANSFRPTRPVICFGHPEVMSERKSEDSFRNQALQDFDGLFAEMEFYCERAALMHEYEASRIANRSFFVELFAVVIGAGALVGLGLHFLHYKNPRLFKAEMAALLVAGLLGYISEGKSFFIATLRTRFEDQKRSAAGWQRLAQETQSDRILLQDPRLDSGQYAEWYRQLVEAKERVYNMSSVSSATVEHFNDPAEVFKALGENKEMFRRYREIQKCKEKKLPDTPKKQVAGSKRGSMPALTPETSTA